MRHLTNEPGNSHPCRIYHCESVLRNRVLASILSEHSSALPLDRGGSGKDEIKLLGLQLDSNQKHQVSYSLTDHGDLVNLSLNFQARKGVWLLRLGSILNNRKTARGKIEKSKRKKMISRLINVCLSDVDSSILILPRCFWSFTQWLNTGGHAKVANRK